MGILDALDDAASYVGNYFKDRFTGVGHAYSEAWTKTIPQAFQGTMAGALTMAQSWQPDRDSFGHGLKLWADSAVGAAGGLLQGTVGGAFEAPGLKEFSMGLDKAYRYTIARPISWEMITINNAELAKGAAEAKGQDGTQAFLSAIMSKDTWFGDRGMWSDQVGRVTPGQALVWSVGNGIGQLNPGNTNDPTAWARSHDPRTPEGQAKYNSDNSEFLLKYASGTTDLLLNAVADPGSAAAGLSKVAKAKYFDHVATPNYVAKGGAEAEINSKAYQKFYKAAVDAKTPEDLRWKTNLAHTAFGGSVAPVLWTAAKVSPEVFRDAYMVARGMDGLYAGKSNIGAWSRLQSSAPRFASDLAHILANWNIGEDATMVGRNALADGAVRSLVLNDLDAFVSALASREGLIGTLPGKLMNEAQPRASLASSMRAGIHTWAMDVAPIKIGRPAAKVVQAFLPSQGWTPFIDAEDPSALAVRQLKANLERGGMPAEKVNEWVSQWGAKASREGRNEVFERAEADAVRGIAERMGISKEFIDQALATISRYRSGARQIIRQNRVYMTERAARQAARNVAAGRPNEAKALRDLNKELTAAEKRGEFGTNKVAFPGPDGELQFTDLPDTGEMPSQAPDMSKPQLVSQTERIIPTLDLRALESQLKWYLRAHPVKMVTDSTTGERRLPVNDDERAIATVESNPLVSKVARAHSFWDAMITSADYANMLWKASALLRPAQMPRNLADDVLRRMLVLGKAHVIMGATTGTKRFFQNRGLKGRLAHDVAAERLAAMGAARTRTKVVEGASSESYFKWEAPADVPAVPGGGAGKGSKKKIKIPLFDKFNKEYADLGAVHFGGNEDYSSIAHAWMDGAISLDDFIYTLKYAAGHKDPDISSMVPSDIKAAFRSEKEGIQSVLEDKFTADDSKLPKTKIWHERALKRRVLEYYWQAFHGDAPTAFLDDFRMKGLLARGGQTVKEIDESSAVTRMYNDWVAAGKPKLNEDGDPVAPGERAMPDPMPKYKTVVIKDPLDPRYVGRDGRVTWLMQLIHKHVRDNTATKRRERIIDESENAVRDDKQEYTARESAPEPYTPGQIVINPFTGEQPKEFNGLHDFTILRHTTLDIKRVDTKMEGGWDLPRLMYEKYDTASPSNKMLDFIVDNLDDFMKPDHTMSMSVTPDGNIRIGVARVLPEAAHKGPVSSTASAGHRLKNFHMTDILDAGHTDIEIPIRSKIQAGGAYAAEGGVVRMKAGFGGPEGQVAQHRLSASEGMGSHMLITGDSNSSRILDQQGGWANVRFNERGYAQSWERAVNAQLSGDPVARKFLEGKTDSDVLTWLESTREGTKYLHRMHYFGVNYVDHIRQIEGFVQIYAPLQDSKAGRELRQAILDKTATREHLDAVVPDQSMQPEVHGASLQYTLGKGAVRAMVVRGIDKAQRLISDLPTDKASRFPFFAESYRRHLTDLVRTADDQGMKTGKMIPARLMENIEHQARERALYDTKYHLYDVAQMNDIARFMRLVVPFSSAIMDSYIKYGRIIRNNPGVILQGAYYWEMFERNQQVQDENGHVLRVEHGPNATSEVWYSVDPKTGAETVVPADQVGKDRYVVFRFPSDLAHLMGKKFFGANVAPVMAINKKSFNVFIDLPSTGPLVALPANEFAMKNPEFGDSAIIRQFVLPFGPSTSSAKVAVPSTVRTAWDLFLGEDGNKAETQAKAIMQAELIAYQRGERDTPPSFAEVRNRSAMMLGLRFANSWVSPVSMQTNSPYQPYIDAYRQLAAIDPATADEKFLTHYGPDFYAVAMTVTRNNAGIRATLASDKSFKAHKALVDAYPDLAGLIVGSDGAGEFSKSVYESQKQTLLRPGSDKTIREVMSLEDSVAELEKRRVWREFSKMQDALTADMADKGLTSLRGKRAAELAKVRDAFVAANKYWTDPASGQKVPSPWYNDYTSVDHALMDKRIEAMWQIVQDPDLQKRDDIRGLIDYLTARESMQRRMASQGLQTLDSRQATTLSEKWRADSFAIRERNPAFANIWSRFLTHDDVLTLGGV